MTIYTVNLIKRSFDRIDEWRLSGAGDSEGIGAPGKVIIRARSDEEAIVDALPRVPICMLSYCINSSRARDRIVVVRSPRAFRHVHLDESLCIGLCTLSSCRARTRRVCTIPIHS